MPLIVCHSAEQFERWFELLVDLADGREVSAAVAVIRGAPHGDDILVVEVVLVAFVDELMGSSDDREIVDMAELVCDFVSE